MADGSRIPQSISDFDRYIRAVVNFLLMPATGVKNWTRLGLTQLEMNLIAGFLSQWYTGNPATPGAYELHTNAYGTTKTKATRLLVLAIIKNFSIAFKPFLTRIEGSANITSGDRLVLRIAEPNPQPSFAKVATEDVPSFKTTSLGGGKTKTTARPASDTARASKLAGFDIRKSFCYIELKGTPPSDPNAVGMQKEVITKAISVQDHGTDKIGMVLCEYLQWYNLRHPELAGPWSALQTTLIS